MLTDFRGAGGKSMADGIGRRRLDIVDCNQWLEGFRAPARKESAGPRRRPGLGLGSLVQGVTISSGARGDVERRAKSGAAVAAGAAPASARALRHGRRR